MNFFISDTHFGCVNKHDNRTLNTDIEIKQKWNKKVNNGDHVYILGDVARFGGNKNAERACEIISTLKGTKHLIIGNHDSLSDARVRQIFVECVHEKEISISQKGNNYRLVLTHCPYLMWPNQHRGSIMLYGHLHNTDEEKIFQQSLAMLNQYFSEKELKGYKDCPPAQAFNVGCMLWNNEPVTLEEILASDEKK